MLGVWAGTLIIWRIHTHIHPHTHACTHTFTHTRTHTYTHTRVRARVRSDTHTVCITHTDKHRRSHTRACALASTHVVGGVLTWLSSTSETLWQRVTLTQFPPIPLPPSSTPSLSLSLSQLLACSILWTGAVAANVVGVVTAGVVSTWLASASDGATALPATITLQMAARAQASLGSICYGSLLTWPISITRWAVSGNIERTTMFGLPNHIHTVQHDRMGGERQR